MNTPEPAYDQIAELIRRFKTMPATQRRKMNENATRQGYILPMFQSLGWDIQNINEVSPEEKVSRGWVDFSFRIGRVPRFFLETKRAAEDLNDPRWVKQAIDYAWTKSVTWALLSDFEGLRVFNAEWQTTNPFMAQFFEFDLDTYLTDFERLWWLSREQTLAGRLDAEAEKVGKRSKRQPVSQTLFDDLKSWRLSLFKDMRGFNPMWSPAQVDEAVLRLLNRLLFLRTAEDRLVEGPRLRALLRELKDQKRHGDLWKELAKLFREMDAAYNSELFAPHFSEELEITYSVLEEVIEGLYEKNFIRYNFNAIDADVLGTVYEQYLGSMIKEGAEESQAEQLFLLPQRSLTVAQRRRKRKSQGIYYTPAFVTQYIVQQTVGKWLAENDYHPARPPRVLDMACGSGSFLIEAFDTIDAFVANLRGHNRGDQADLFDHARQLEVLMSCIFGVDKDPQAVEVARLNLLLRALHSREPLPMLENIYCGDSLQPETWETFTPTVPDGTPPPISAKLGEAGRGFDIIIGNPPYVRQETLGPAFKTFAKEHFETYAGTADLYVYFIEQAHKMLKPGGYFGMIVSNKWMRANYGKALRKFLTENAELLEIIDFGELPVFGDAATFPMILLTRKREAEKQNFTYAPIKRLDFDSLAEEVAAVGSQLDERSLEGANWTLTSAEEQAILHKIQKQGTPLHKYLGEIQVLRGIITGLTDAFVIGQSKKDAIIRDDPQSAEYIFPFIVGNDVRKYRINSQGQYLIRIPKGWTNQHKEQDEDAWEWFEGNYPALSKHLKPFAERAAKRQDQGDYWWELRACGYYDEFEKPKIVYPDIAKESRVAFDGDGLYFSNTVYFIPLDDLYLLAILNSKLIFAYFKRIASVLGDPDKGGRLRWFRQDVLKLPIRSIDFTNPTDKTAHEQITALVEKMLALQKTRQSLRPEENLDEFRKLDRRIQRVDDEIDRLVYQLYGLTKDEIGIIEDQ